MGGWVIPKDHYGDNDHDDVGNRNEDNNDNNLDFYATTNLMVGCISGTEGVGGCWNPSVGTLENGYVRNVPLPRIPRIQSTNQVASVLICREPAVSCYSRIAWIPTYSELMCSPEGFGTIQIVPFFPLVG